MRMRAVLALVSCASSAFAGASAFRVISKSADPKPQGGLFNRFLPPIYDGETIGFRDQDFLEVYKAVGAGAPSLVAKTGELAPGFGGGTYSWLDIYSQYTCLRPRRQGIPYHGQAPFPNIGTIQSIWSDIDQPNNLAAEFMTAPDGGTLNIFFDLDFASDDRNVLFAGATSVTPTGGAYCVLSGDVRFICNNTTVVPFLGTTISSISATGDIRNEFAITRVVAPAPNPDWTGILRYRLSNGTIDYPVRFDDLVPFVGETFIEIAPNPVLSEDGKILFHVWGTSVAQNTNTRGVFLWQDNFITKIAQTGDPRPDGGTFLFDNFAGNATVLSASGDRVAFSYTVNFFQGLQAIFIWRDGALSRAVGPGTKINGKTVSTVRPCRSMLAGFRVAFTADFTDGKQAVVVANICTGDFNDDGLVEDADFVDFAAAYNLLLCTDPIMPENCPADLNGDGFVDDSDFVLFAAAYNALLCE
ncbi:MAG: hypothetical protein KF805_14690 [Phycisphaeraceae bacterium]|nr:hypothetical protein [Phycisphaeraceae bacterium]